MSQAKVHGVFPNHSSAQEALDSLVKADFAPGKLAVIGEDSDEFRRATAVLQSRKVDKLILWMGIGGAALGGLSGLFGMPHLPAASVSILTAVPLWAAFTGAAIGMSAGITIGGMLRIDGIPGHESEIQLGKVHDGDMAITVVTNNLIEQEEVHAIFAEQGARLITIELDLQPAQKPQLVAAVKPSATPVALNKTA
jgi:hypothetical protein